MDASASTKPDADITNVLNFFLKLDNIDYPTPSKQKYTVIKFAKLPDFHFDSKVRWPAHSYSLKPRLRRIISLDEDDLLRTSRSLNPNTAPPPKMMTTCNSYVKRKIVTISEDDEHDLHPKFSKDKKPFSVKTTNRCSEAEFKNKQSPNQIPRLSNSTKSSKEIKTSAKTISSFSKKEVSVAHQNFRGRMATRPNSPSQEHSKIKNAKEKETLRSSRCLNQTAKTSVSKNSATPSESEKEIANIKNILYDNLKTSKEIKTSAKTISSFSKKEVSVAHQNFRGRRATRPNSPSQENSKIKNAKEKETLRSSRCLNQTAKTSVSKNSVIPSESENEIANIKNILYDNLKSKSVTYKRHTEKPKPNTLPHLQNKSPKVRFREISNKGKPLATIHVPLDDKFKKRDKKMCTAPLVESIKHTVDYATETNDVVNYKDAVVATDPLPTSISQITEMQDFEINTITTTCESTIQTDSKKTLFDSLEIPNVTLTKDKSEPKEAPTVFNIASLPNLEVPPVKIVPQDEEVNSSDKSFCQSASYIISRATVTYTTRQKFNFQLVGTDDDVGPSMPPSPLHYPMNVVSVLKSELKSKKTNESVSSDDSYKKKNRPREEYLNHLNDLKTLNCSYVFNKLMKPSDIISTIRVNSGLLQSDYICEQFQRELNFIDSFFESLQYLETCSLRDKCHPENKVENFTNNSVLFDSTFDVKSSEYDNFLSKLENGANIDDTETMASKSLCLLNLLIRDEQRRAKNLLFVLKMREDALKDFTKSQILWLEKKKRHENTDISTLKKKQRGALLKLQHECGEMQRMRKALLALSEKRKVALMKTKKNIELKLRNNVDVDQIILGKKKLKRSTCFDRNAAPLKCFDLSSSGCEESSTSKATSDASLMQDECAAGATSVTSAEKCVQTSDAHCVVDCATDTAAEHFVVVDGGYLNILFHNLTLPQIFSSGKQYEVNEEALRNIVHSANSHNTNLRGSEVVEKLMDQIKNKDSDNSSSPSTARSLIEEFDQYYNDLNGEDKSRATTPELKSEESSKVYEIKDSNVQAAEVEHKQLEELINRTSSVTITCENTCRMAECLSNINEPCVCDAVESEGPLHKEPVTASQVPTGPLPVPVGAAAVVDSQLPDVPTWLPPKSNPSSPSETDSVSSQSLCGSVSSIASLSAPVHVEAEELRRQQLAIEREIKALEQQQCRLLVVREIPDKPPPPYTPPTETRTAKPPRMFTPDENLEEKVEKYITDPAGSVCESTEAFSVFVQDYCLESLEKHKQELSDKPWDACNLLPQKPQVEIHELVETTSSELKDVLTTVIPAAVSGVSSRRSDHIDDILFAEWRRCEPEWTALHTDEVLVKNQIFESIFQKILTDTIDEYKKTVQCEVVAKE